MRKLFEIVDICSFREFFASEHMINSRKIDIGGQFMKYCEYLNADKIIDDHIEELQKRGIAVQNKENQITELKTEGLYATRKEGRCIICNSKTKFRSNVTWKYVCSDNCRRLDRDKSLEVNKYAFLESGIHFLIKHIDGEARMISGYYNNCEITASFDEVIALADEVCKAVVVE